MRAYKHVGEGEVVVLSYDFSGFDIPSFQEPYRNFDGAPASVSIELGLSSGILGTKAWVAIGVVIISSKGYDSLMGFW